MNEQEKRSIFYLICDYDDKIILQTQDLKGIHVPSLILQYQDPQSSYPRTKKHWLTEGFSENNPLRDDKVDPNGILKIMRRENCSIIDSKRVSKNLAFGLMSFWRLNLKEQCKFDSNSFVQWVTQKAKIVSLLICETKNVFQAAHQCENFGILELTCQNKNGQKENENKNENENESIRLIKVGYDLFLFKFGTFSGYVIEEIHQILDLYPHFKDAKTICRIWVESHECSFCGKSDEVVKMKRCSRCWAVQYCSKQCQTQDWDYSQNFQETSFSQIDKAQMTQEKLTWNWFHETIGKHKEECDQLQKLPSNLDSLIFKQFKKKQSKKEEKEDQTENLSLCLILKELRDGIKSFPEELIRMIQQYANWYKTTISSCPVLHQSMQIRSFKLVFPTLDSHCMYIKVASFAYESKEKNETRPKKHVLLFVSKNVQTFHKWSPESPSHYQLILNHVKSDVKITPDGQFVIVSQAPPGALEEFGFHFSKDFTGNKSDLNPNLFLAIGRLSFKDQEQQKKDQVKQREQAKKEEEQGIMTNITMVTHHSFRDQHCLTHATYSEILVNFSIYDLKMNMDKKTMHKELMFTLIAGEDSVYFLQRFKCDLITLAIDQEIETGIESEIDQKTDQNSFTDTFTVHSNKKAPVTVSNSNHTAYCVSGRQDLVHVDKLFLRNEIEKQSQGEKKGQNEKENEKEKETKQEMRRLKSKNDIVKHLEPYEQSESLTTTSSGRLWSIYKPWLSRKCCLEIYDLSTGQLEIFCPDLRLKYRNICFGPEQNCVDSTANCRAHREFRLQAIDNHVFVFYNSRLIDILF